MAPPAAIAAVYVPSPAIKVLAVFKSFFSVQLVPLYSSVSPLYVLGGTLPPKASEAVLVVPAPVIPILAVFKLPPLDQVALGMAPAFPKPFNVVPLNKNREPSVKNDAVAGCSAHSSVADPKFPAGV